MFTPALIERLEAFDAGGAKVLSVYLDLDPHSDARRSYRIIFKDLVAAIRQQLDKDERRLLDTEVDHVNTWLDAYKPTGNGVVIFRCEPRLLRLAQYVAIPVPNHVFYESRPDVAPLLDVLDEYERYAVALVDDSKARFFTVFAGEIEEDKAFSDFVPRKHDQGGLSQANFQRHREAHVFRHLKRVALYLTQLLRRRSFDRLIIAGPAEVTAELQKLLSRVLASRLAAVIPADIHADNAAQILAKTLEIERQKEREVEDKLLQEVMEVAGAGGRATVGVAKTLGLGDVRTLVVSAGANGAGVECTNCGRLEKGRSEKCSACGMPMKAVHDIFHRAMARTIEQSGSVEVLHGEAARRLLDAGGGLGARLRYRLPPVPLEAQSAGTAPATAHPAAPSPA